MKLLNIREIKGKIRLQTGLHIGAGKDSVEIGGLDQPIIKDPRTGAPYIPGSSFKGKMRSLLETAVAMNENQATAKAVAAGRPCDCGKKGCPICSIFGSHNPADKCDPDLGPTRLLVRDAMLENSFQELFEQGELPMEIKYENIIHRVRGTAEHPRPLERVPAGVCFDLNLSLKVYEGDPDTFLDYILKGLKLIELDALGGCSSRGSGQVIFEDLTVDAKAINLANVQIFQAAKA